MNFSPFYKPEGRTEKGTPVSRGASSHFSALTIKELTFFCPRGLGKQIYAPQFEGTEVDNFLLLVLTVLNQKYAVYSDFSLEIPKLKSLGELKQRVMDVTMFNLGQLASMMGFAWSGGCFAKYSGDDFRRNGDKWESTYR